MQAFLDLWAPKFEHGINAYPIEVDDAGNVVEPDDTEALTA